MSIHHDNWLREPVGLAEQLSSGDTRVCVCVYVCTCVSVNVWAMWTELLIGVYVSILWLVGQLLTLSARAREE